MILTHRKAVKDDMTFISSPVPQRTPSDASSSETNAGWVESSLELKEAVTETCGGELHDAQKLSKGKKFYK